MFFVLFKVCALRKAWKEVYQNVGVACLMMDILRIDISHIWGRKSVGVCIMHRCVFQVPHVKKKKMENLTTIVRYSVMWNDKINCKGGLSFNVVKAPYILCREG